MPTKKNIDKEFLIQHDDLESEFFDIVNKGKPSQHRVLKLGKTIEEFNQRHGEIWRNHETDLIAEGFMKPPPPPEEKGIL